MVRAENFQTQFDKILEAKIFLVARAAKLAYQKIGGGFEEYVYRDALQKEFESKRIRYKKECPVEDSQTAMPEKQEYRSDFLCFNNLVLHTMTGEAIPEHTRRQVQNCLEKMKLPAGLIVNFGKKNLLIERVFISGRRENDRPAT